MRLVIRRPDDPSFEVVLGDDPLRVGSAPNGDMRLTDHGVADAHLLISLARVEAIAELEMGGVRLRAGGRRLCVPSTLRVGSATLSIESLPESSVATRELALRSLATPSSLWPSIVVVEGPSSGRDLSLQRDGVFRVGRDPRSELPVDDLEMSRAHFEISVREGAVLVRDCSTSGSWLGAARLEAGRRALWPPHRMVRAGRSVFALVVPHGLARALTPTLSRLREWE